MTGGATLKEVFDRHRTRILQIESVVGVSIGLSRTEPGEPCILVYAKTDDWPAELERDLEGYRVELVKTSGFHTF